MTIERLTEQQIEEEALYRIRLLTKSPGLVEQYKAMIRLGRGGTIRLVHKGNNDLQLVGFDNQVQADGTYYGR